jgi:hypothetical protein
MLLCSIEAVQVIPISTKKPLYILAFATPPFAALGA